jgi:LuxR family maltose regulon positive regulatory protein
MTSRPLLQRKFHPPPLLPPLLVRPPLLKTLQKTVTHPLTLISAPAGFGKTTAAAALYRQIRASQPAAWLTLDSYDADPNRFWRYFFNAVGTAVTLPAGFLQAVQSGQPPATQPLLIQFLNILESQTTPFTLFLDGYHQINSAQLHNDLTFLIENGPLHFHLVLLTRADPPLPLHRWRVSRRLGEIRLPALRFSPTETANFMSDLLAEPLSATELALLQEKTEGWPVGVHLAGLALRDAGGRKAKILHRLTSDNAFILEYLTAEVLQQQPAEIQAFILQTAFLPRLCDRLCRALLDPASELPALRDLVRRNLFLLPLEGEWYRYHPLFAQLVHGRFQHQQPQLAVQLTRRAARWFADNQRPLEALDLAFQAGDYPFAGALLEQMANDVLLQGDVLQVEYWRQQMPLTHLERLPWTNLAFARALLLRGRYEQVAAYLDRAAEWAGEPPLCGQIALQRATLAETLGDAAAAFLHAQEAITLIPEEDEAGRTLAGFVLAGAQRERGAVAEAVDAYLAVIHQRGVQTLPLIDALSRAHLSFLYYLQGRLRQATAIVQPLVDAPLPTPMTAAGYNSLAMVNLAWNRLDLLPELLDKAAKLIFHGGHNALAFHNQVLRARYHLGMEDLQAAAEALANAAEMHAAGAPSWLIVLLAEAQAAYHLARHDPLSARQAVAAAWSQVPAHLHGILALTEMRISLAQVDEDAPAEFAGQLAQFFDRGELGARRGWLLEGKLLRAVWQWRRGERRSAIADFTRAVELAAPEGYVRPFIEWGETATALCRATDHPYAQALLVEWLGGGRPSANNALPDPLTEREQEVLRLIAAGLTYQQIADQLVVSLNTVRHHVKGVYSKLDVRSRGQAVARAGELGLV